MNRGEGTERLPSKFQRRKHPDDLLAAAQRARVQALPVEQLEDLGEALLDFAAAADLDDWLNVRAKQSKAE